MPLNLLLQKTIPLNFFKMRENYKFRVGQRGTYIMINNPSNRTRRQDGWSFANFTLIFSKGDTKSALTFGWHADKVPRKSFWSGKWRLMPRLCGDTDENVWRLARRGNKYVNNRQLGFNVRVLKGKVYSAYNKGLPVPPARPGAGRLIHHVN